jgi:hypothetical protein
MAVTAKARAASPGCNDDVVEGEFGGTKSSLSDQVGQDVALTSPLYATRKA